MFSRSRNQCNWNQESMEQEIFNGRGVMESWLNAPWFNMDLAAKMIDESSRALRRKDSGHPE